MGQNESGVRVPQRRLVAKKLWPQVKLLPKKQRWQLIEKALSDWNKETTIGFDWLWRSRALFESGDLAVFEKWLEKYVDDWAKCDDFCTHSVGYLISQDPPLAKKVFSWTKSKNRWMRRAAAVSLIYPSRQSKKWLPQIFKTAEALLSDPDDLVQKGYGWMLKETSNHHPKEVFRFVMKHKSKMPRTALRYAIEKFSRKLKQQAMT